MFDWIAQNIFSSMWGWLGTGGLIIAGLLAVAWFLPPFRRSALAGAGVVASVLAIYAKGSRDAKRRERERQAAAERAAIARGNNARSDAQRDVAAGRVRDKFDRDDL